MGQENLLLSGDAQRALEEFSNEFAMALSQDNVEQWSKALGLAKTSTAIKTTYPIPIFAALYAEFKGDVKYRDLFEKSINLSPKTWQDGVAALASVVEAPDFSGWAMQPMAMAAAAQSLPNEIVAGLLEANAVQEFDGKAFFASDHPFNIGDSTIGTFDNDFTGAGTDPTVENLALAMQGFDELKAPNGKPLGLRMTHVAHPPSQRQKWKTILESDSLIQAVGTAFGATTNIYKNAVIPVCMYELENSSQWYPMALNKPGLVPWIVQDEGVPEQIVSDKTSHLYATTLKIGIAMILRGNGGLALPHSMQRWAGTAP